MFYQFRFAILIAMLLKGFILGFMDPPDNIMLATNVLSLLEEELLRASTNYSEIAAKYDSYPQDFFVNATEPSITIASPLSKRGAIWSKAPVPYTSFDLNVTASWDRLATNASQSFVIMLATSGIQRSKEITGFPKYGVVDIPSLGGMAVQVTTETANICAAYTHGQFGITDLCATNGQMINSYYNKSQVSGPIKVTLREHHYNSTQVMLTDLTTSALVFNFTYKMPWQFLPMQYLIGVGTDISNGYLKIHEISFAAMCKYHCVFGRCFEGRCVCGEGFSGENCTIGNSASLSLLPQEIQAAFTNYSVFLSKYDSYPINCPVNASDSSMLLANGGMPRGSIWSKALIDSFSSYEINVSLSWDPMKLLSTQQFAVMIGSAGIERSKNATNFPAFGINNASFDGFQLELRPTMGQGALSASQCLNSPSNCFQRIFSITGNMTSEQLNIIMRFRGSELESIAIEDIKMPNQTINLRELWTHTAYKNRALSLGVSANVQGDGFVKLHNITVKKLCDSDCWNRGQCNDGKCICESGYSGDFCSKADASLFSISRAEIAAASQNHVILLRKYATFPNNATINLTDTSIVISSSNSSNGVIWSKSSTWQKRFVVSAEVSWDISLLESSQGFALMLASWGMSFTQNVTAFPNFGINTTTFQGIAFILMTSPPNACVFYRSLLSQSDGCISQDPPLQLSNITGPINVSIEFNSGDMNVPVKIIDVNSKRLIYQRWFPVASALRQETYFIGVGGNLSTTMGYVKVHAINLHIPNNCYCVNGKCVSDQCECDRGFDGPGCANPILSQNSMTNTDMAELRNTMSKFDYYPYPGAFLPWNEEKALILAQGPAIPSQVIWSKSPINTSELNVALSWQYETFGTYELMLLFANDEAIARSTTPPPFGVNFPKLIGLAIHIKPNMGKVCIIYRPVDANDNWTTHEQSCNMTDMVESIDFSPNAVNQKITLAIINGMEMRLEYFNSSFMRWRSLTSKPGLAFPTNMPLYFGIAAYSPAPYSYVKITDLSVSTQCNPMCMHGGICLANGRCRCPDNNVDSNCANYFKLESMVDEFNRYSMPSGYGAIKPYTVIDRLSLQKNTITPHTVSSRFITNRDISTMNWDSDAAGLLLSMPDSSGTPSSTLITSNTKLLAESFHIEAEFSVINTVSDDHEICLFLQKTGPSMQANQNDTAMKFGLNFQNFVGLFLWMAPLKGRLCVKYSSSPDVNVVSSDHICSLGRSFNVSSTSKPIVKMMIRNGNRIRLCVYDGSSDLFYQKCDNPIEFVILIHNLDTKLIGLQPLVVGASGFSQAGAQVKLHSLVTSAICEQRCENGGSCNENGLCSCLSPWFGPSCNLSSDHWVQRLASVHYQERSEVQLKYQCQPNCYSITRNYDYFSLGYNSAYDSNNMQPSLSMFSKEKFSLMSFDLAAELKAPVGSTRLGKIAFFVTNSYDSFLMGPDSSGTIQTPFTVRFEAFTGLAVLVSPSDTIVEICGFFTRQPMSDLGEVSVTCPVGRSVMYSHVPNLGNIKRIAVGVRDETTLVVTIGFSERIEKIYGYLEWGRLQQLAPFAVGVAGFASPGSEVSITSFRLYSTCSQSCANGGFCNEWGVCVCSDDWIGKSCIDIDENIRGGFGRQDRFSLMQGDFSSNEDQSLSNYERFPTYNASLPEYTFYLIKTEAGLTHSTAWSRAPITSENFDVIVNYYSHSNIISEPNPDIILFFSPRSVILPNPTSVFGVDLGPLTGLVVYLSRGRGMICVAFKAIPTIDMSAADPCFISNSLVMAKFPSFEAFDSINVRLQIRNNSILRLAMYNQFMKFYNIAHNVRFGDDTANLETMEPLHLGIAGSTLVSVTDTQNSNEEDLATGSATGSGDMPNIQANSATSLSIELLIPCFRSCNNFGYCAEFGTCACIDGWSGSECDTPPPIFNVSMIPVDDISMAPEETIPAIAQSKYKFYPLFSNSPSDGSIVLASSQTHPSGTMWYRSPIRYQNFDATFHLKFQPNMPQWVRQEFALFITPHGEAVDRNNDVEGFQDFGVNFTSFEGIFVVLSIRNQSGHAMFSFLSHENDELIGASHHSIIPTSMAEMRLTVQIRYLSIVSVYFESGVLIPPTTFVHDRASKGGDEIPPHYFGISATVSENLTDAYYQIKSIKFSTQCFPECVNGGFCSKTGTCNCVDGWTGSSCDIVPGRPTMERGKVIESLSVTSNGNASVLSKYNLLPDEAAMLSSDLASTPIVLTDYNRPSGVMWAKSVTSLPEIFCLIFDINRKASSGLQDVMFFLVKDQGIQSTPENFPKFGISDLRTLIGLTILISPSNDLVCASFNSAGLTSWTDYPQICNLSSTIYSSSGKIEGFKHVGNYRIAIYIREWSSLEAHFFPSEGPSFSVIPRTPFGNSTSNLRSSYMEPLQLGIGAYGASQNTHVALISVEAFTMCKSTCLNGGFCNDEGLCSCSIGWIGPDCSVLLDLLDDPSGTRLQSNSFSPADVINTSTMNQRFNIYPGLSHQNGNGSVMLAKGNGLKSGIVWIKAFVSAKYISFRANLKINESMPAAKQDVAILIPSNSANGVSSVTNPANMTTMGIMMYQFAGLIILISSANRNICAFKVRLNQQYEFPEKCSGEIQNLIALASMPPEFHAFEFQVTVKLRINPYPERFPFQVILSDRYRFNFPFAAYSMFDQIGSPFDSYRIAVAGTNDGYEGSFCSLEQIDFFVHCPGGCLNGGQCQTISRCSCAWGFTGKNCDLSIGYDEFYPSWTPSSVDVRNLTIWPIEIGNLSYSATMFQTYPSPSAVITSDGFSLSSLSNSGNAHHSIWSKSHLKNLKNFRVEVEFQTGIPAISSALSDIRIFILNNESIQHSSSDQMPYGIQTSLPAVGFGIVLKMSANSTKTCIACAESFSYSWLNNLETCSNQLTFNIPGMISLFNKTFTVTVDVRRGISGAAKISSLGLGEFETCNMANTNTNLHIGIGSNISQTPVKVRKILYASVCLLTCLNGGSCDETGHCVCTAGYFGRQCQYSPENKTANSSYVSTLSLKSTDFTQNSLPLKYEVKSATTLPGCIQLASDVENNSGVIWSIDNITTPFIDIGISMKIKETADEAKQDFMIMLSDRFADDPFSTSLANFTGLAVYIATTKRLICTAFARYATPGWLFPNQTCTMPEITASNNSFPKHMLFAEIDITLWIRNNSISINCNNDGGFALVRKRNLPGGFGFGAFRLGLAGFAAGDGSFAQVSNIQVNAVCKFTCRNGAICRIDGICICPPQFTGIDCSTLVKTTNNSADVLDFSIPTSDLGSVYSKYNIFPSTAASNFCAPGCVAITLAQNFNNVSFTGTILGKAAFPALSDFDLQLSIRRFYSSTPSAPDLMIYLAPNSTNFGIPISDNNFTTSNGLYVALSIGVCFTSSNASSQLGTASPCNNSPNWVKPSEMPFTNLADLNITIQVRESTSLTILMSVGDGEEATIIQPSTILNLKGYGQLLFGVSARPRGSGTKVQVSKISLTALCLPACSNGGSCLANGVCACTIGWRGKTCEEEYMVANMATYLPSFSYSPTTTGPLLADISFNVAAAPLNATYLNYNFYPSAAIMQTLGDNSIQLARYTEGSFVMLAPVLPLDLQVDLVFSINETRITSAEQSIFIILGRPGSSFNESIPYGLNMTAISGLALIVNITNVTTVCAGFRATTQLSWTTADTICSSTVTFNTSTVLRNGIFALRLQKATNENSVSYSFYNFTSESFASLSNVINVADYTALADSSLFLSGYLPQKTGYIKVHSVSVSPWCHSECMNGGICNATSKCECLNAWSGEVCRKIRPTIHPLNLMDSTSTATSGFLKNISLTNDDIISAWNNESIVLSRFVWYGSNNSFDRINAGDNSLRLSNTDSDSTLWVKIPHQLVNFKVKATFAIDTNQPQNVSQNAALLLVSENSILNPTAGQSFTNYGFSIESFNGLAVTLSSGTSTLCATISLPGFPVHATNENVLCSSNNTILSNLINVRDLFMNSSVTVDLRIINSTLKSIVVSNSTNNIALETFASSVTGLNFSSVDPLYLGLAGRNVHSSGFVKLLQFSVESLCLDQCQNGGVCSENGTCSCNSYWTGPRCQFITPVNQTVPSITNEKNISFLWQNMSLSNSEISNYWGSSVELLTKLEIWPPLACCGYQITPGDNSITLARNSEHFATWQTIPYGVHSFNVEAWFSVDNIQASITARQLIAIWLIYNGTVRATTILAAPDFGVEIGSYSGLLVLIDTFTGVVCSHLKGPNSTLSMTSFAHVCDSSTTKATVAPQIWFLNGTFGVELMVRHGNLTQLSITRDRKDWMTVLQYTLPIQSIIFAPEKPLHLGFSGQNLHGIGFVKLQQSSFKAVCADGPCFNGGNCSDTGTCKCASGWKGQNCNISIFCSPICQNNGSCVDTNICLCESGWTSVDCSIPICDQTCRNGGNCTAPNTCTCAEGWDGPTCDTAAFTAEILTVEHVHMALSTFKQIDQLSLSNAEIAQAWNDTTKQANLNSKFDFYPNVSAPLFKGDNSIQLVRFAFHSSMWSAMPNLSNFDIESWMAVPFNQPENITQNVMMFLAKSRPTAIRLQPNVSSYGVNFTHFIGLAIYISPMKGQICVFSSNKTAADYHDAERTCNCSGTIASGLVSQMSKTMFRAKLSIRNGSFNSITILNSDASNLTSFSPGVAATNLSEIWPLTLGIAGYSPNATGHAKLLQINTKVVCDPSCLNNGTCSEDGTCSCPIGWAGVYCHIPVCIPTCLNGGTCNSPNNCLCQSDFNGSNCGIYWYTPNPLTITALTQDETRARFVGTLTVPNAEITSYEAWLKYSFYPIGPSFVAGDNGVLLANGPTQSAIWGTAFVPSLNNMNIEADISVYPNAPVPVSQNVVIFLSGDESIFRVTDPSIFSPYGTDFAKFKGLVVYMETVNDTVCVAFFSSPSSSYDGIEKSCSLNLIKKAQLPLNFLRGPFHVNITIRNGTFSNIRISNGTISHLVEPEPATTISHNISSLQPLRLGIAGFCPDNVGHVKISQLAVKSICPFSCSNGGICNEFGECICLEGWTGSRCEEPICDPPCQNNGICSAPYFCVCMSTHQGTTCETAAPIPMESYSNHIYGFSINASDLSSTATEITAKLTFMPTTAGMLPTGSDVIYLANTESNPTQALWFNEKHTLTDFDYTFVLKAENLVDRHDAMIFVIQRNDAISTTSTASTFPLFGVDFSRVNGLAIYVSLKTRMICAFFTASNNVQWDSFNKTCLLSFARAALPNSINLLSGLTFRLQIRSGTNMQLQIQDSALLKINAVQWSLISTDSSSLTPLTFSNLTIGLSGLTSGTGKLKIIAANLQAVCVGGCANSGNCTSSGYCYCSPSWKGADCSIAVTTTAAPTTTTPTPCNNSTCKNGGSCISTTGMCVCTASWTGEICSSPLCNSTSSVCPHSNSHCNATLQSCICNEGWLGENCSVPNCHGDCLNGGVCNGPNTCFCNAGYSGTHCGTASCSLSCGPNGFCVEYNKCVCLAGWSGVNCSNQLDAESSPYNSSMLLPNVSFGNGLTSSYSITHGDTITDSSGGSIIRFIGNGEMWSVTNIPTFTDVAINITILIDRNVGEKQGSFAFGFANLAAQSTTPFQESNLNWDLFLGLAIVLESPSSVCVVFQSSKGQGYDCSQRTELMTSVAQKWRIGLIIRDGIFLSLEMCNVDRCLIPFKNITFATLPMRFYNLTEKLYSFVSVRPSPSTSQFVEINKIQVYKLPTCVATCRNGATCYDAYFCNCTTGYKGSQCETAICSQKCRNNGSCSAPNVCNCTKSWTGHNCTSPVCEPSCQNEGVCVSHNTCKCPDGWSGPDCSSAICNQSCNNGGTCIAPNKCSCIEGWTGDGCLQPLCTNVKCDSASGSECIAPDTCGCARGYTGDKCTTPICSPNCYNGGTCIGPNNCTCTGNWTGPLCDIPVCSQPCQQGGNCTSPDMCTCPDGWEGNFCQHAICSKPCRNNGRCYAPDQCNCTSQWTGEICTTPICTDTCMNGGKCVGPNICQCPLLWTGKICNKSICDPLCLNGGSCTEDALCICPQGFAGSRCEKTSKATCKDCQNGACIEQDVCSCSPGWTGPACSSPTCNLCANGGVCKGPNMCDCPNGWTGATCETPVCSDCPSGKGTCIGPERCSCRAGWSDDKCQTPVCLSTCANGGSCVAPDTCVCAPEYTGLTCIARKTEAGEPANDENSKLLQSAKQMNEKDLKENLGKIAEAVLIKSTAIAETVILTTTSTSSTTTASLNPPTTTRKPRSQIKAGPATSAPQVTTTEIPVVTSVAEQAEFLSSLSVVSKRMQSVADAIPPEKMAEVVEDLLKAADQTMKPVSRAIQATFLASAVQNEGATSNNCVQKEADYTTPKPESKIAVPQDHMKVLYGSMKSFVDGIVTAVKKSPAKEGNSVIYNGEFYSIAVVTKQLKELSELTVDTLMGTAVFPKLSGKATDIFMKTGSRSWRDDSLLNIVVSAYLANVVNADEPSNLPTVAVQVFLATEELFLNPSYSVKIMTKPASKNAAKYSKEKSKSQCDISSVQCDLTSNADSLASKITFPIKLDSGDFVMNVASDKFGYYMYLNFDTPPTTSSYVWLATVDHSTSKVSANSKYATPKYNITASGFRIIIPAQAISSHFELRKISTSAAITLHVLVKRNFPSLSEELPTEACDIPKCDGYHLKVSDAKKGSSKSEKTEKSRRRRSSESSNVTVDSVELDLDSTESGVAFKSNYFGAFGADLAIVPNTIEFTDIFANFDSLVSNNAAVLALIVVTVSIFVVTAISITVLDKRDLKEWAFLALKSNEIHQDMRYLISVHVNKTWNYDLEPSVAIRLFGDVQCTPWRTLEDGLRKNFKATRPSNFVMNTYFPLGVIRKVEISLNAKREGNSEKQLAIHFDKVIVVDVLKGRKYVFLVKSKMHSGQTRTRRMATEEEIKGFRYILSGHSKVTIREAHPWLSIIQRPLPSNWTRAERVSTVVSALFLAMLVNAMFYGKENASSRSGVSIGGFFRISWFTFYTSFISCVIIIPPTTLISLIFQYIKRRSAEKSDWATIFNIQVNEVEDDDDDGVHCDKTHQKTNKKLLPFWCIGIAWFVVAASIFLSSFFVILYSLSWGQEKSLQWLAGMFLAILQDVLIIQTAKTMFLAVFNATRLKLPDDGVDLGHITYPKDNASERMELFKKFRNILVGIGHHALYVFLFAMVIATTHNDFGFVQVKSLRPIVSFPGVDAITGVISDYSSIFDYLQYHIVPSYLNGNQLKYGLYFPNDKLLTVPNHDVMLIGAIRVRQQRVNPEECQIFKTIPSQRDRFAPNLAGNFMCHNAKINSAGFGTSSEIRTFNGTWAVETDTNAYIGPNMTNFDWAWVHRSTDGPYYIGEQGSYISGGYYVDLPIKMNHAVDVIELLRKTRWLDHFSTIVFVDFNLYNPQLNLYSVVKVIFEPLSAGGLSYQFRISPCQLYQYSGANALISLLIQTMWIIVLISQIAKICHELRKQGFKKWYKNYWNRLDAFQLLLGVTIVILFAFRVVLAIQTVEQMRTQRSSYTNLDLSAQLEDLMFNLFGFAFFFSMMTFFKHLTIDRYWSTFLGTLSHGRYDILSYSGIFFIASAITAAYFYLIVGDRMWWFATFKWSIYSLVTRFSGGTTSNLTKLQFPDVYSKFCSIVYSAICLFMGANVFVTIIGKVYSGVKSNIEIDTDWDANLYDYVTEQLKKTIKIRDKAEEEVEEKLAEEQAQELDHVDEPLADVEYKKLMIMADLFETTIDEQVAIVEQNIEFRMQSLPMKMYKEKDMSRLIAKADDIVRGFIGANAEKTAIREGYMSAVRNHLALPEKKENDRPSPQRRTSSRNLRNEDKFEDPLEPMQIHSLSDQQN